MFNIPFFNSKKQICIKPFNNIEIDAFGDVYTCCPAYIKFYKIGNIWDENIKSINDIWYSKEACTLRKQILKNDYSLCNLDICKEKLIDRTKCKKYCRKKPPLPETITLAYDKECNLQCIMCRDEKINNTKEEEIFYNQKLDLILLPLLNNAKLIQLCGSGEALYSKHSRKLIKSLTNTNKTTKFNILTNGLLFNKENYETLGLINRIEDLCISIHAIDKNLYNKIMHGSNLDIVLKNLKWASELQKKHEIKRVFINMVINAFNYREMPKLLELAKKYTIWMSYTIYYPWGTTLDNKYDELTIWNENHPEHKEFIEILKEVKAVNYDKCTMPACLEELLK